MKFKIFTKSRSNSRILTPKLIEEGFFDIYKNEIFNNQILTIRAVIESDDDFEDEHSYGEETHNLSNKVEELQMEEYSSDGEEGEEKEDSHPPTSQNDKNSTLNINKHHLKPKEPPNKTNSELVNTYQNDKIYQLRNSIFKKLDALTLIQSKDNQNNLETNIQDILSIIGKRLVDGVNTFIESSHSTIFKKHSVELRDIHNIVQEYNNNEISSLICRLELQQDLNDDNDNFSYETLNNTFKYDTPIKGIGHWSEQGLNHAMDDRWFISKLSTGPFFGILDSYNGGEVATEAEQLLVQEFDTNVDQVTCLNKYNIAKAFLKTVLSIDRKIITKSKRDSLNSGSGLISCFIFHPEPGGQFVLFSCCLGESRGFLSRNNEILKFQNELNIDKNVAVSKQNLNKHDGIVKNSFGFGYYKPPFKNEFEVSNVPQVFSIDLIPKEDKFIVIATDSIWKVLQEDEVNEMVSCILKEIHEKYPTLNKQIISTILSHSIVTESLLRGVTDNQVCMVVLLD